MRKVKITLEGKPADPEIAVRSNKMRIWMSLKDLVNDWINNVVKQDGWQNAEIGGWWAEALAKNLEGHANRLRAAASEWKEKQQQKQNANNTRSSRACRGSKRRKNEDRKLHEHAR